jgi:predicted  nucleic acid-binding Zn-ribbon protein
VQQETISQHEKNINSLTSELNDLRTKESNNLSEISELREKRSNLESKLSTKEQELERYLHIHNINN